MKSPLMSYEPDQIEYGIWVVLSQYTILARFGSLAARPGKLGLVSGGGGLYGPE